jgi:hypothetical protein
MIFLFMQREFFMLRFQVKLIIHRSRSLAFLPLADNLPSQLLTSSRGTFAGGKLENSLRCSRAFINPFYVALNGNCIFNHEKQKQHLHYLLQSVLHEIFRRLRL